MTIGNINIPKDAIGLSKVGQGSPRCKKMRVSLPKLWSEEKLKGIKSKENLLWALESDDLEWSVYA